MTFYDDDSTATTVMNPSREDTSIIGHSDQVGGRVGTGTFCNTSRRICGFEIKLERKN